MATELEQHDADCLSRDGGTHCDCQGLVRRVTPDAGRSQMEREVGNCPRHPEVPLRLDSDERGEFFVCSSCVTGRSQTPDHQHDWVEGDDLHSVCRVCGKPHPGRSRTRCRACHFGHPNECENPTNCGKEPTMTMPDLTAIARVCHEANRAYQHVTGDPVPSPAWDDAPEWQRASSVEGVEKALYGATPEELHESWVESKERDGWVYGEVKDGDAKTHPCLVEYHLLPEEQRRKDALFYAVVEALRP